MDKDPDTRLGSRSGRGLEHGVDEILEHAWVKKHYNISQIDVKTVVAPIRPNFSNNEQQPQTNEFELTLDNQR